MHLTHTLAYISFWHTFCFAPVTSDDFSSQGYIDAFLPSDQIDGSLTSTPNLFLEPIDPAGEIVDTLGYNDDSSMFDPIGQGSLASASFNPDDSLTSTSQGSTCDSQAAADFALLGKREKGVSCGTRNSGSDSTSEFDPNDFLNKIPIFDSPTSNSLFLMIKDLCDPGIIGDRPYPVCHSGTYRDVTIAGLELDMTNCYACMFGLLMLEYGNVD